jgi:hypothetical protein
MEGALGSGRRVEALNRMLADRPIITTEGAR